MVVLRRMDEARCVERFLPSQCGKTQMAHIEPDRTAIVAESNSGGLLDINYVKH